MSFNSRTSVNSGANGNVKGQPKFANKSLAFLSGNTSGTNASSMISKTAAQKAVGKIYVAQGSKTKLAKPIGASALPIPLNTPSMKKESESGSNHYVIVSGGAGGAWGSNSEKKQEDTGSIKMTSSLVTGKPAPWARNVSNSNALQTSSKYSGEDLGSRKWAEDEDEEPLSTAPYEQFERDTLSTPFTGSEYNYSDGPRDGNNEQEAQWSRNGPAGLHYDRHGQHRGRGLENRGDNYGPSRNYSHEHTNDDGHYDGVYNNSRYNRYQGTNGSSDYNDSHRRTSLDGNDPKNYNRYGYPDYYQRNNTQNFRNMPSDDMRMKRGEYYDPFGDRSERGPMVGRSKDLGRRGEYFEGSADPYDRTRERAYSRDHVERSLLDDNNTSRDHIDGRGSRSSSMDNYIDKFPNGPSNNLGRLDTNADRNRINITRMDIRDKDIAMSQHQTLNWVAGKQSQNLQQQQEVAPPSNNLSSSKADLEQMWERGTAVQYDQQNMPTKSGGPLTTKPIPAISSNTILLRNPSTLLKSRADTTNESDSCKNNDQEEASTENYLEKFRGVKENIVDENDTNDSKLDAEASVESLQKSFASLFPNKTEANRHAEEQATEEPKNNDSIAWKYVSESCPPDDTLEFSRNMNDLSFDDQVQHGVPNTTAARPKLLFDPKSSNMIEVTPKDEHHHGSHRKDRHASVGPPKLKSHQKIEKVANKEIRHDLDKHDKHKEITLVTNDQQSKSNEKKEEDTQTTPVKNIKEARENERLERGPRTKGFLYCYNNKGHIERILTEKERKYEQKKDKELEGKREQLRTFKKMTSGDLGKNANGGDSEGKIFQENLGTKNSNNSDIKPVVTAVPSKPAWTTAKSSIQIVGGLSLPEEDANSSTVITTTSVQAPSKINRETAVNDSSTNKPKKTQEKKKTKDVDAKKSFKDAGKNSKVSGSHGSSSASTHVDNGSENLGVSTDTVYNSRVQGAPTLTKSISLPLMENPSIYEDLNRHLLLETNVSGDFDIQKVAANMTEANHSYSPITFIPGLGISNINSNNNNASNVLSESSTNMWPNEEYKLNVENPENPQYNGFDGIDDILKSSMNWSYSNFANSDYLNLTDNNHNESPTTMDNKIHKKGYDGNKTGDGKKVDSNTKKDDTVSNQPSSNSATNLGDLDGQSGFSPFGLGGILDDSLIASYLTEGGRSTKKQTSEASTLSKKMHQSGTTVVSSLDETAHRGGLNEKKTGSEVHPNVKKNNKRSNTSSKVGDQVEKPENTKDRSAYRKEANQNNRPFKKTFGPPQKAGTGVAKDGASNAIDSKSSESTSKPFWHPKGGQRRGHNNDSMIQQSERRTSGGRGGKPKGDKKSTRSTPNTKANNTNTVQVVP